MESELKFSDNTATWLSERVMSFWKRTCGQIFDKYIDSKGTEKEKKHKKYAEGFGESKKCHTPALYTNFSSDFIKNFCQWMSLILLCTWNEEGKAAALDRAAQFTVFLQEAVPWLWAEIADSEPVWQSSHRSTKNTGHLNSTHGWKAEAVQLKSSGNWRRWVMLSNLATLLQFFSLMFKMKTSCSQYVCILLEGIKMCVTDTKFPLFAWVILSFKRKKIATKVATQKCIAPAIHS